MKKIVLLLVVLGFGLAGCASGSNNGAKSSNSTNISTEQSSKSSDSIEIPKDDKYTKHLKNYVGRNASQVGTERLNGKFMDSYGPAHIPLVFITEGGEVITSDNIQNYVVTSQEPSPGSEIILEFDTDDSGNEYNNVTKSVSLNEIILNLKKVEEK